MFRKYTYLYHQTDDPDDARQQIVASAKSNTSAQRDVWLRPALWLLAFALWVVADVVLSSYEAANGPMIPSDSPMVWISILVTVAPIFAAILFVPDDFRRDRANLAYRNSLMDLSLFAGESDDFFVDYVNYESHVESGTPYHGRSRLDAEQVGRDFREVVDQYDAVLKKSNKRCIVVLIVVILLMLAIIDQRDVSLIVNPYMVLSVVGLNALVRAATTTRARRMLKAVRERADQGGYALVFLRAATLRYRLTGFI